MDLLYICNGFPFPLTSGYLRHYHLIGELAREHRVTLATLVGPRFRTEHREALADRTVDIITVPSRAALSRAARLRSRLTLLASQGDPAARRLGHAIHQLRTTRAFQAVVFSGKRTFPALDAVADLPLVVDLCDAASLRLRGQLLYAPITRKPMVALDLMLTREIEHGLLRRADHLLFASWRDREALLTREPHAPSSTLPNGIDLERWQRRAPRLGVDTIVFSGAMDYPPNVDAAVRLAEVILPRVRVAEPQARLILVGRDPTPRISALAQRSGVTVTGYVDDVRPFLEEASVFAAPIRFGAGIQNKVLEAMAMAVPGVVSPVAAAGLQVTLGQDPPLDIAAEDAAFAAALVERLRAARLDPTPDLAGRDWVGEHFSWRSSGARLGAVLRELTDHPVDRGPGREAADVLGGRGQPW